jgi:protein SCO1/2
VLASSLPAQVAGYGDKQMGPANEKPSVTSKISISQHLNQSIPLNAVFTDETGKQVALSSYFGQKPAILALVYYQCPMLCSEELNGLTGALQKRTYLKRYGHPESANGWHFLTGTQPNIDALTQAVGFGYTKIPGPDGKLTQYAHASTIQIVTPLGKIAQYYMGVEYSPKDLRLGLAEASDNRIGSPVDNILTYCYHYDPGTNKHSLIIARIVQLGGLVTVLTLGGFMYLMFRADAKRDKQPQVSLQRPATKVNG